MADAIDIKFNSNWTGYKNYRDITNLKPTDITAGSQNVFVEDGIKLACRGGSSYLGAAGTVGTNTNVSWTLAHRIHSDYDQFVNNQGIIMPFRVYYSGTTAQGDVMEVWLPEYVAGVAQTTKRWYKVNATVPTNPIVSAHKWYFAEWYDSLNADNRIVFTYGSPTVQSYSGGFAPITALTATTIVTNGTWVSKGFINSPEGINRIVVNVAGVPTEMAITGNFNTNTITVVSTAGVVVNDLVFQVFNSDTIDSQATPTGFNADVCSTINNQVYYIDWRQRNVLVSWNRNRTAFLSTVIYEGTSGLNDAVFTGTYTGTTTDVYKVFIDSINPASNTQSFYSVTGGPSSAYFDYTGYTGTGTNIYKMSIIADSVFTFVGATISGTFVDGELVVGQTSGTVLRFIVGADNSLGAVLTEYISGTPDVGAQETFYGLSSGATGDIFAFLFSNSAQLYKNNIQLTTLTGMVNDGVVFGVLQFALVGNQIAVPAQLDGLNFVTTEVGGNNVGDYYTLTINAGGPDKFSWSLNGTTIATGVTVSTSPTLLSQGISVKWVKNMGHAIGDNWTITGYPNIIRGWRQVYFTVPTRLPGEGFKIQLDSNGWAEQPQEKSMYINGQAGEYYNVQTQLSADLQTETIQVDRLKTEQQKKVLFPYLMTSEPNFLSIVSTEKTWDILGRQKFLELPQAKTLSDYVKVDFQTSDWTNGTQRYMDRKQFFVVPEENSIFIYDDFMKYWHPPQKFGRRISSIAFIDGQICGHSYERNETYKLFTEDRNDLGIYTIKSNIVLSYFDWGKRFNKKTMSAIAFDGYIDGAPEIAWRVNFGVGGCEGNKSGIIKPILCLPPDTASLGKSSLGFHGLGNSPTNVIPHFVYGATFDNANYYLRNIELSCVSDDQRWSITSMGTDLKYNLVTNSNIFNPA